MTELDGGPVSERELAALGLINYGHFTSMRVDDGKVRGLSLHVQRLTNDARTLFAADLDPDRIRDLIRSSIGSKRGSLVVRLTVFDPDLSLGRPADAGQPKILVTTRDATSLPASPLKVKAVQYQREVPQVKHIGLFGALVGRRTAQLAGYDDALFFDGSSHVSEGATWNVGFFDGERVMWPEASVLPGVTMRLLQSAHPGCAVTPIRLTDLNTMQAAFATNTSIGVRAISAIDSTEFDMDHQIITTLRKAYEEVAVEQI